MKTCPLCGENHPNRVFILKMIRALGLSIVNSDADTITIQVPKEGSR